MPSLPRPTLLDSRVLLSNCATSAPLSLLTDATNSLNALEEILVSPYPVTVNSAPPPQKSGAAPAPSGPVACSS